MSEYGKESFEEYTERLKKEIEEGRISLKKQKIQFIRDLNEYLHGEIQFSQILAMLEFLKDVKLEDTPECNQLEAQAQELEEFLRATRQFWDEPKND